VRYLSRIAVSVLVGVLTAVGGCLAGLASEHHAHGLYGSLFTAIGLAGVGFVVGSAIALAVAFLVFRPARRQR